MTRELFKNRYFRICLMLCLIFVGGNQRELARAKNQKKQQELMKSKKNNDGLTLEQRKFR